MTQAVTLEDAGEVIVGYLTRLYERTLGDGELGSDTRQELSVITDAFKTFAEAHRKLERRINDLEGKLRI